MNPKKTESRKSRNAGISLTPEVKERATKLAERMGFKTLSAYAHKLLTDALKDAADATERAGEELQASAKRKLRERKQQ